jgi:hypothetical protein
MKRLALLTLVLLTGCRVLGIAELECDNDDQCPASLRCDGEICAPPEDVEPNPCPDGQLCVTPDEFVAEVDGEICGAVGCSFDLGVDDAILADVLRFEPELYVEGFEPCPGADVVPALSCTYDQPANVRGLSHSTTPTAGRVSIPADVELLDAARDEGEWLLVRRGSQTGELVYTNDDGEASPAIDPEAFTLVLIRIRDGAVERVKELPAGDRQSSDNPSPYRVLDVSGDTVVITGPLQGIVRLPDGCPTLTNLTSFNDAFVVVLNATDLTCVGALQFSTSGDVAEGESHAVVTGTVSGDQEVFVVIQTDEVLHDVQVNDDPATRVAINAAAEGNVSILRIPVSRAGGSNVLTDDFRFGGPALFRVHDAIHSNSLVGLCAEIGDGLLDTHRDNDDVLDLDGGPQLFYLQVNVNDFTGASVRRVFTTGAGAPVCRKLTRSGDLIVMAGEYNGETVDLEGETFVPRGEAGIFAAAYRLGESGSRWAFVRPVAPGPETRVRGVRSVPPDVLLTWSVGAVAMPASELIPLSLSDDLVSDTFALALEPATGLPRWGARLGYAPGDIAMGSDPGVALLTGLDRESGEIVLRAERLAAP